MSVQMGCNVNEVATEMLLNMHSCIGEDKIPLTQENKSPTVPDFYIDREVTATIISRDSPQDKIRL